MPFINGHALIIGIGSYQYSPLHTVPATAADAQAVTDLLQDTRFCGYPTEQVRLLTGSSATRTEILAALDRLAQTQEDDTVLLFYSGHGDYDTGGNYMLTTHDTQWQNKQVVSDTAISQAELLARLKAISAGRVLLIFNACHAGNLSPTPTLGDDAATTGSALPQQTASALLSTGSGRIVITACRETQVAFVGSGNHTLFAQALVDGLRGGGDVYNRNGYISVFDLYTHLYYTLGEAVQRDVPQNIRDHYGTTQEPELTVLKGVGPFAVALYRGASTLSQFPADHIPATDTAVREVSENRSQRAFEHISGTATVQGDNSGQNVGVNYGTMTQSNQTINNQAPNQGAQGTFQGPVNFDQRQTSFDQRNQQVQGTQYNAGRDLTRSSGDVTQVSGDYVKGDKSSSNINVGNISGSGIAIGHKAQANVQQGGDADTFARAFAQVYEAINARQPDPDVDKDQITSAVKDIEQEARKGDNASEKRLTGWLRYLATMAEDIFDVTVAALTGPQAAAGAVVRKVAQKAKQEHKD